MTDEDPEGRFWAARPGDARTPHDLGADELEPHAFRRPQMFPPVVYAGLSVLAIAVAIWALVGTWAHVAYCVGGLWGEAVDLGDLRVRHRTEAALDQPSGLHVRFSNAIVKHEAGSQEGGYNFFYSPLYHLIVRTKQDFPAKRMGHSFQVEDHLVEMIARHEIEPVDLSSGFAGDGRLYRATDLPGIVSPMLEYYGPGVRAPVEQIYVFLDGDTPASNWPYVLLWLAALAVMILNVRALARLLRASSAP
jgi:hypothetical protein